MPALLLLEDGFTNLADALVIDKNSNSVPNDPVNPYYKPKNSNYQNDQMILQKLFNFLSKQQSLLSLQLQKNYWF